MNTPDMTVVLRGDRAIVLSAISAFFIIWSPNVVSASEISKFELAVWESLCAQTLPGTTITWTTREGFNTWLKDEESRVEPVIVKWLHTNRDSKRWKQGMFVAKKIPTKAICDAVFENVLYGIVAIEAKGGTLRSANPSLYVGSVSILAKGYDPRAIPLLNDLVLVRECPYRIGRKYLEALQKVGDATSLPALREMPLRKTNERIDHMAALTEEIIEARVEGKVFPPQTAPEDLRTMTQRFLKACEAADLQAYTACFPWGFQKVVDDNHMREFLDGEHWKPALAAIRASLDADTPFEINRGTFQAKLVCDGGYDLEYIYEVDGWKVLNLRPSRADSSPRPPVVYPESNGKRFFIGKPAKGSGNQ